jgi:FkbM family methyltransferase
MNTIERGGFHWPASDDWCWRVIHDELPDLDEALKLVPGRKLAVQAGGNVGVWAAHLAKTFETVMTFEPVAENYACLIRNVPANVISRQCGLGDKAGTTGMTMVEGNAGAHYIGGSGSIDLITLDSLGLDACDFLCLDIEGAEPMALHGAAETIRRFRPVIMMEEKGLSERYYRIAKGAAERWLRREFGYKVAKKVRKDVILVP